MPEACHAWHVFRRCRTEWAPPGSQEKVTFFESTAPVLLLVRPVPVAAAHTLTLQESLFFVLYKLGIRATVLSRISRIHRRKHDRSAGPQRKGLRERQRLGTLWGRGRRRSCSSAMVCMNSRLRKAFKARPSATSLIGLRPRVSGSARQQNPRSDANTASRRHHALPTTIRALHQDRNPERRMSRATYEHWTIVRPPLWLSTFLPGSAVTKSAVSAIRNHMGHGSSA